MTSLAQFSSAYAANYFSLARFLGLSSFWSVMKTKELLLKCEHSPKYSATWEEDVLRI